MKIYLSSASYNLILIQSIEKLIYNTIPKVSIVSDWYKIEAINTVKDRAYHDIKQVEECDILIAFYPYGESGTLCEMSYALGIGKQVIYVRDKSFNEEDPFIVGIFSFPGYNGKILNSLDELITELKGMGNV